MTEFNVKSDAVDVDEIMKQIRTRIREKRGVDYTEEQIRELATVKLEKFLDPKNLRSDLLEQFRRSRPAVPSEPTPIEPPYDFSDETIYETHRGPLRFMRKLLNPLLKLLFNPNPLIHVLHKQSEFNVDLLKREQRRRIEFEKSRAEWNALYYEVLHNLVLETTRSGIEIKNLKMRLEALASRLDFSERRVRALEGVVQYRPDIVRPRQAPQQSRWDAGADASAGGGDAVAGGAARGHNRAARRRKVIKRRTANPTSMARSRTSRQTPASMTEALRTTSHLTPPPMTRRTATLAARPIVSTLHRPMTRTTSASESRDRRSALRGRDQRRR
jgi:hypothetical protein